MLDTQRIRKFWPLTVVAIGLGLTAAWTYLLVYGVIKLAQLAMRIVS